MPRSVSPSTSAIVRRVQPHLALVEIPGPEGSDPILAPGVVASTGNVALSLHFLAGRFVADVLHGTILARGRRWPACLTGMRTLWATCSYGAESDGFPIPPAPMRWSHTLHEGERIVVVTPRADGRVSAVGGVLDTLEPCADNQPYERSRLGVGCFTGRATPGAFVFDSEARLVGLLGDSFAPGGRVGVFLGAERLSGLPDVPLYMLLLNQGRHWDLIKTIHRNREVQDPRVLGTAAIAGRHIGNLPLTLKALDTLLVRDPEHAWACFERAVVLQELGRPAESGVALERAIALDPGTYDWRRDERAV
jgi:hypothetical protein